MTTDNEIQIADIEKELKSLWEKNKSQKKIKACLFNLVIYTQEERRAEYFKDIIVSIIDKFPCRIIFIQRNPAKDKNHLYVTVSNETYSNDSTTIACDEITIKVAGKPLERVPYIISPHLVPDLPIYLLWGEDPTTDNEILPYFQKFADRLIFDTECSKDLRSFANVMIEKMHTLKMEIMDLNWALISPWRDVIGQVFKSNNKIRDISKARTVIIRYNNLQSSYFCHNETQSLYLQAWLAAQLDWQIESIRREQDTIELRYNTSGGPLSVKLEPDENSNLRYGAIIKLNIETYENNIFLVSRQHTLHKVVVHITTKDQCLLPFTMPLPNLKRGYNFMKEIFYEKSSNHYHNMLKQLTLSDWTNIY